MPRFFIPTDHISGSTAIIDGSDAHHISHVLRMAKGDGLLVCDMGRREHSCIIKEITPENVVLEIISTKESSNEPTVKVTLYQGLPKSDKLEQIIQKAVELGVYEIVPVEAERSIVKVNGNFEKKLERYNAISLAAAKQCGRGMIPKVSEPIKFPELVKRLSAHGKGFICYEGECAEPISQIAKKAFESGVSDIGFYIGPEGGLSDFEIKSAEDAGISLCTLGKRILRTETASGCVLSVLMLLSGNLE